MEDSSIPYVGIARKKWHAAPCNTYKIIRSLWIFCGAATCIVEYSGTPYVGMARKKKMVAPL